MFVNKGKELGIAIDHKPCFCKYHREGNDLDEIFKEAAYKSVQLIIAILPGKTQYYGEFLKTRDSYF